MLWPVAPRIRCTLAHPVARLASVGCTTPDALARVPEVCCHAWRGGSGVQGRRIARSGADGGALVLVGEDVVTRPLHMQGSCTIM